MWNLYNVQAPQTLRKGKVAYTATPFEKGDSFDRRQVPSLGLGISKLKDRLNISSWTTGECMNKQ